nr:hypothetical protein [Acinetobacter variabilis]
MFEGRTKRAKEYLFRLLLKI